MNVDDRWTFSERPQLTFILEVENFQHSIKSSTNIYFNKEVMLINNGNFWIFFSICLQIKCLKVWGQHNDKNVNYNQMFQKILKSTSNWMVSNYKGNQFFLRLIELISNFNKSFWLTDLTLFLFQKVIEIKKRFFNF